jgi:predicted dehydrogenase
MHRRSFFKSTAAVTALSYGRILAANERVRIGAIGVGGRCRYLLGQLNKLGGNELVAVCDVYEPHRQEAREKHGPQAREFLDYRQLLEQKNIDAIVIGSPDHWHVAMTIDAVSAGKDVYVEKPVTHTIEEGTTLQKAVDESKQVVQTGMQQRSWPHFIQGRELVVSGALGQITLVLTYWYQNHLGGNQPEPVELQKLDWKRWLGAAPDRPFDPIRFRQWRWFWDYGGGAFTDLFVHWVDVVHWYMMSDTPRTIQAMGERYVLPEFEAPDTQNASLHYPGNFQVVYNGTLIGYREGGGLTFRGTKAMLRVHRGGFSFYPELPRYSETPDLEKPLREAKSVSDGTQDHLRNFLDCVKSRRTPNAPVSTGIAAARAGYLANLALRRGTTVHYPEV